MEAQLTGGLRPNKRMDAVERVRFERNETFVHLALIRVRSLIGVAGERVGSQVMR